MDQIAAWFESYGLVGLFVISFIESIFSPILPDVILIPMCLANPSQAIYYSIVATAASVLGGFVGYAIGYRFGIPALQKVVPRQHVETIDGWLKRFGGWAIWIAAMAPIPYKFVSITAGVFKVNLFVFSIASIPGRAKRFLVSGILIYFYGEQAVELISRYSQMFLSVFAVLAVIGLIYAWRKISIRRKMKQQDGE